MKVPVPGVKPRVRHHPNKESRTMRMYNVKSRDSIFVAAQGVCRVEVDYVSPSRGGGFTFKVKCYPLTKVHPNLYRKYSVSGMIHGPDRRVNALCWHGFEAFFKRFFKEEPQARVVTSLANYDGKEGFEATYPATIHTVVGPPIYPLTIGECCTCTHWTDKAEEDEKKYGPVKYPKF